MLQSVEFDEILLKIETAYDAVSQNDAIKPMARAKTNRKRCTKFVLKKAMVR